MGEGLNDRLPPAAHRISPPPPGTSFASLPVAPCAEQVLPSRHTGLLPRCSASKTLSRTSFASLSSSAARSKAALEVAGVGATEGGVPLGEPPPNAMAAATAAAAAAEVAAEAAVLCEPACEARRSRGGRASGRKGCSAARSVACSWARSSCEAKEGRAVSGHILHLELGATLSESAGRSARRGGALLSP
jgi:hypothetical protein